MCGTASGRAATNMPVAALRVQAGGGNVVAGRPWGTRLRTIRFADVRCSRERPKAPDVVHSWPRRTAGNRLFRATGPHQTGGTAKTSRALGAREKGLWKVERSSTVANYHNQPEAEVF
jgi:hypothetical protein